MATRDKGRAAVAKKNTVLERLNVEYVPIDSLHPNSWNPNRQSEHDFELLQRSMREDGFTQPIICLTASRDIVDGEHRWRAAGALGYTEVPVVFVDMTPEQARISTLRHNRARGSEDIELSAQVLRDLRELGALDWAQDSLMLDDSEMTRLLDDVSAPDGLAGDEFSGAWQPGEDGHAAVDTGSENGSTSMTPAALTRIRDQERAASTAATESERIQARRDLDVFRLSLVFAGDEAATVRKALGDQPAVRVLELCKNAVGGNGHADPTT